MLLVNVIKECFIQGAERGFGICNKGGFDQVLETKGGFTGEGKDEIFTVQRGKDRTSEAEEAMGGSQNLGLPEPHLPHGSGFSLPQPFSSLLSWGSKKAPGKWKLCVYVHMHT